MSADWDDRWLDAVVAITSLRNRIRVNAAFSGASGAFMVGSAPWLSEQLGTDRQGIVRLVGMALLAYAVDLLVTASARWSRVRSLARGVVVSDMLWVAGSVAALAAGAVDRAVGVLLVLATATAVGALAVTQQIALSRAHRLARHVPDQTDLTPPIEAIRIERTTDLDAAHLWRAVGDHELFGRLARNLDRVEVVHGEGTDLVRRCVATNGNAWTERCTLWEPGRRHAVEVDTSAYPYPLTEVGCLSYVEDGNQRTAGLVFRVRARRGFAGQAMIVAVHLGRPMLSRIVAGWVRIAANRQAVPA